jgi:hypothetical protein
MYAAHKKEALEIALLREDVFEHDPVVVALACFLLVVELCFNLSELDLDVGMTRTQLPQSGKVLQALL